MKKFIVMHFFAVSLMFACAASGGVSDKVQTCVACHGSHGVSVNPEWPNLAGQHARYLLKQLLDYKAGINRTAAIMMGMTANLTEQDMRELADYYASMPRGKGKTPKKYFIRGEAIYRGGDSVKGIMACIACHGPTGAGNAQAGFPVVAGQQALYTIQQLQLFKNKTRHNDLNQIMQDISGRLNQEDMIAVAYYMQGLTD